MDEKEKQCNCSPECDCGCIEGKTCHCEEETSQEYCSCSEGHDCQGEGCEGDSCSCTVEKEDKKQIKKDKKEKKDKAKQEITELHEKVKQLEQKVLGEKAELINYRKRKDEEVSYMLKYANEDMVKEILPMVDNFERAIKLDDDNLEDSLSKFLEGFKMIYCHLIQVLESFGVKAIDGNNKTFDPTYHEAIMTEAREGVEPGTVLEVMQKGYLLKDKVIRPAMVKVSE